MSNIIFGKKSHFTIVYKWYFFVSTNFYFIFTLFAIYFFNAIQTLKCKTK